MQNALLHRIQNLLITRNHLANRINKPNVREAMQTVEASLQRAVNTYTRRYGVRISI